MCKEKRKADKSRQAFRRAAEKFMKTVPKDKKKKIKYVGFLGKK